MRILWTVLGTLAALVVVAGALAWSGVYNVAATRQHFGPVAWLLHTVAHRSIERRAEEVSAPALDQPGKVEEGARLVAESCVVCHGGPGVDRSDLAHGLNPKPPGLAHLAAEHTPEELFWIAKNGIRMTGMPGFAPTYADEEIWSIVAFLRALPQVDPARFREMVAEGSAEEAVPHVVPPQPQGPWQPGDAAR